MATCSVCYSALFVNPIEKIRCIEVMKLFQNDVNIFINTTSEQVNNMELNGAYDILTP